MLRSVVAPAASRAVANSIPRLSPFLKPPSFSKAYSGSTWPRVRQHSVSLGFDLAFAVLKKTHLSSHGRAREFALHELALDVGVDLLAVRVAIPVREVAPAVVVDRDMQRLRGQSTKSAGQPS